MFLRFKERLQSTLMCSTQPLGLKETGWNGVGVEVGVCVLCMGMQALQMVLLPPRAFCKPPQIQFSKHSSVGGRALRKGSTNVP